MVRTNVGYAHGSQCGMQTLNVLITTQFKPMGNLPGPLYAASTILTLPILVLFFLFSKYFKEGITIQFK